MRTSYARGAGSPGIRHIRTAKSRGRGKSLRLGPGERLRLAQLAVCAALFLAVMVGKGAFPDRMQAWRQDALELLRQDTDFKAVFVGLGRSISEGEPLLDALGDLFVETFGAAGGGEISETSGAEGPIYQRELSALSASRAGAQSALLTELTASAQTGQGVPVAEDAALGAGTGEETGQTAQLASAAQPALLEPEPKPVYTGPALPENCSMDEKALGLKDTVTPVMGVLSSGFGYRTHPVDGEYKFHYGADLVADEGTPVLAFADGTVDYIGESAAYGQYVQLRHAGGVTTFYAHCSKLLVQKGQKISKGDKIALVGQTGNTTGPHLHLEVRLDGVYLDPTYYIQHQ